MFYRELETYADGCRVNESSWHAGTTTAHRADSRLPGASERLLEPVQLKPDILFPRRITRGVVRHAHNSFVERRVALSRDKSKSN